MAITMTELAKRLSLSQSTVSLVINNRDKGRVRPEVAERIREMVRETGFRLNRAATDLRRRRSGAIGIALPSSKNGYHAALITELHREVIQNGYRPIFAFFETEEQQKTAASLLLSNNIEAIITGEPRWLPDPMELPVVSFYYHDPRFDSVELGSKEALRLALNYLHDLGHRTVGWLGSAAEPRAVLLPELTAEFGMTIQQITQIPSGTLVFSDGTELVDQYRRHHGEFPSAFLAHNDMVAIGAIRRLHELGLRVPEDISIIGQDDLAEAVYTIPALTTIAYETPAAIAQKLTAHVLRKLQNPGEKLQRTVIPPHLVIRESCGPCNKNKTSFHKQNKTGGRHA